MATTKPQINRTIDDATAHQRGKEDFLRKYEGAVLSLPTTFHNRTVIRQFKRTYMANMRNWHIATQLAQTKLRDAAASSQVESAMLNKIKATIDHFDAKLKQMQVVQAAENVDTEGLSFGKVHSEPVTIVGPVAMRNRELLIKCDNYLSLAAVLYAHGVLPKNEHDDASYDVKKKLRGVSASLRTLRVNILQKLNENGLSRPNYMNGEAGGSADSAGDEAGIVVDASGGDPTDATLGTDTPVAAGAQLDEPQAEAAAA